jgi:hypothetical protein
MSQIILNETNTPSVPAVGKQAIYVKSVGVFVEPSVGGEQQFFTTKTPITFVQGTGVIAPATFISGANLVSPLAGVLEYDGKVFYKTPVIANRGLDVVSHFICQTVNWNGLNSAVAQPVFNASATGTITLPALTSYEFEGLYNITNTGIVSHTLGLLFGGTATLTSIGYSFALTNSSVSTASPMLGGAIGVATNSPITPATAAATSNTIFIKGIVRTNGAGTFIPQFIYSVAPGAVPVISMNSYFKMTPLGLNTVATVGNWS